MYEPIKVCENKEAKLLWDRTIHTYKTVTHNKPDIVLKNKKAGLTYLIDIAVLNQNYMSKTVSHKISKYKELSMELTNQWKTRTQILANSGHRNRCIYKVNNTEFGGTGMYSMRNTSYTKSRDTSYNAYSEEGHQ